MHGTGALIAEFFSFIASHGIPIFVAGFFDVVVWVHNLLLLS